MEANRRQQINGGVTCSSVVEEFCLRKRKSIDDWEGNDGCGRG